MSNVVDFPGANLEIDPAIMLQRIIAAFDKDNIEMMIVLKVREKGAIDLYSNKGNLHTASFSLNRCLWDISAGKYDYPHAELS